KRLKSVDRPAIIRAIAEARENGDLSENAEYHSARERQSFIEGRVLELEDKIARAEVIDVSKLSGKLVKFGATVTLADEETDEKVVYQIVGEDEADISQRRLSVASPLARALIGKGIGESIEVSTPRGARAYEVVKVAFRCAARRGKSRISPKTRSAPAAVRRSPCPARQWLPPMNPNAVIPAALAARMPGTLSSMTMQRAGCAAMRPAA